MDTSTALPEAPLHADLQQTGTKSQDGGDMDMQAEPQQGGDAGQHDSDMEMQADRPPQHQQQRRRRRVSFPPDGGLSDADDTSKLPKAWDGTAAAGLTGYRGLRQQQHGPDEPEPAQQQQQHTHLSVPLQHYQQQDGTIIQGGGDVDMRTADLQQGGGIGRHDSDMELQADQQHQQQELQQQGRRRVSWPLDDVQLIDVCDISKPPKVWGKAAAAVVTAYRGPQQQQHGPEGPAPAQPRQQRQQQDSHQPAPPQQQQLQDLLQQVLAGGAPQFLLMPGAGHVVQKLKSQGLPGLRVCLDGSSFHSSYSQPNKVSNWDTGRGHVKVKASDCTASAICSLG
jgi:hypothetical protein